MTGNVLIKNRTPSSDVPYLFGLPKQKTTLLRHTSVLRSKTLAEGEFTSPEHFNFLPESKKEVTTYVVTSFLERATRLARGVITPRHAQRAPSAPLGRFLASLAPCSPLCPLEPKNKGMTYVMPLFFGAGDEARTRYLHLGKVALYQMSYGRIFGAFYLAPIISDALKTSFKVGESLRFLGGDPDRARTDDPQRDRLVL